MRLDQHLAALWPEYSRSSWQKFIASGYVKVNGTVQDIAKTSISDTDNVTVSLPEKPDFQNKTLPVIYEDEHVIVIHKPSGVLTHAKGELSEEFTVADFMRHRMNEADETNRPGIVHRLDRDTSGVIICARDSTTKRLLQKQFQDRKAHKTYIAVVRGTLKHPTAKLELPIERNPKAPSTFRVGVGGKSASTTYRVLGHNANVSIVELKPETGRTHQLRVHLAHLGHPIVGDKLYNGGTSPLGRLCLHAQSLEITIPTSQRRTFVASLPEDFSAYIDRIEPHAATQF